MAWLPRGTSSTGLLFKDGQGQSATVPALATYRGRLWCLWTDLDGKLWYAQTGGSGGHDEQFGERQPFPQAGLPVLANLNGVLHVIIVDKDSGTMAHYVHDDDDVGKEWDSLGPLVDASTGGDGEGEGDGKSDSIVTHSTPAVVSFHNKLFLAFLRDGRLYYTIWSALGADAKVWAVPQPVAVAAGDEPTRFRGIPALFVIGGVLHLLCGADTEARHILGFRYDYIANAWAQCDDVSEGRAASGVSAVSFGSRAFLGIIEAGPEDETHSVYVAACNNGAWEPHEAVAGTTAADPPQIAMLYGQVHCIFNDHTKTKDLRWYSRPVLRYALTRWMAELPDDVPVSQLTIPGTHDSCARSNIPFVRTQYLSISQQLALGIRFLDLRLRRHKDGKLYCYHGGIAINMPRYLSFASVMDEVWRFLWPDADNNDKDSNSSGRPPSETVLISINNDDHSQAQQDNPAEFYAAVADAIASTPPWPAVDGSHGSPGAQHPPPRHRWHVEPVTPTLGAVRGKAVLLRRYAGDPAVPAVSQQGLDVSAWLDDNPDFTIVTPTQVRVRLQDKWKYAERIALHDLVASKSRFVRALMEAAAGQRSQRSAAAAAAADNEGEDEHDWYLNFCSCVGDPAEHGEIAEAKWIAVGAHSDFIGKWVPGMNVLSRDYLQQNYPASEKARLGVVNLDYPELPEDNDLVARLIETNFGR